MIKLQNDANLTIPRSLRSWLSVTQMTPPCRLPWGQNEDDYDYDDNDDNDNHVDDNHDDDNHDDGNHDNHNHDFDDHHDCIKGVPTSARRRQQNGRGRRTGEHQHMII